MEPVEITSPDALNERIDQGGVITVTRAPATPLAHTLDCRAVKRIRISTSGGASGGQRELSDRHDLDDERIYEAGHPD